VLKKASKWVEEVRHFEKPDDLYPNTADDASEKGKGKRSSQPNNKETGKPLHALHAPGSVLRDAQNLVSRGIKG
jgi:hypothetical protein